MLAKGEPFLPEARPGAWERNLPYQKRAVAQAIPARNHLLLMPCGSGKTITACWWSMGDIDPVITVCPASVRDQWVDDLAKVSTIEPRVVLPFSERSPKDETIEDYLARVQRPFLITSWDGLRDPRIDRELGLLWRPAVIFDEVHKAADHRRARRRSRPDGTHEYERLNTATAQAVRLSRRASRKLGLSGTVIGDRVRNLWGVLDLIWRGRFGKYWDFATRYCGATTTARGHMDDSGRSNLDELAQLLAPLVFRVSLEEARAGLPPARRVLTHLTTKDLTPPDSALEAEVKRARHRGGDEEGLAALEAAAVSFRKRRWIADHVIGLLEERQKVLVFTATRADAEWVAADVKEALGTAAVVWWADGEVPASQRAEIRKAYMACRDAAAIIATGDAFGVGHNLHDTDRLVIMTIPFTWVQAKQWEGRVVGRRGQTRRCLVEFIVADGTTDERRLRAVMEKLPAIEAVVGDEDAPAVREALQGSEEGIVDSLIAKLSAGSMEPS